MQVETTAHLACPLCKRQFLDSSEHAPSTRLCQQCQEMVLTAFRGSNPIVPQPAVVVPQPTSPLPIQIEEQSFDQGLVSASSLFEATTAEANESEPQLRPPIPFDAPDPVNFNFYQEEDPDYKTNGSPVSSPDFTGDAVTSTRMHVYEASADESFNVDEPQPIAQPSASAESTIESAFATASFGEDEPTSVEPAGTDEWQTPAATSDADWDTSAWPLLVAPAEERSFRKPRLAIAAVAAIAILVSATGFYLLINRSSDSHDPRAIDAGITTKASAVETRAASVGSAVTASLAPAVQSENAAQAKPAEGPSAATGDNTIQGQFSLQAASFPTQEGADEFAERLRRASVPSYVVPAELIRRGRWFRVRVGRFNSAEDAQRFAGEAQQRARAAGIAVQLIVCQYGQP